MNPLTKIKSKPGYRWVVVACCFVMVMICLGFCSSTAQMFLAPTTAALELPRGLYSIHTSIRSVCSAVFNMFFGFLVLKFGPRKLIGAGFTCLIGANLAFALAEDLTLIYIGGALLGIGLSWTTTSMVAYVVHHWCKENKATIMSAVLAANGLGGAIAAQILNPIIESGTFGYRTARYVIALVLILVGTVVVLLFKNEPDGVEREAQQKKKAKAGTWSGISLQDCLRKPWFYTAAVCVFLFGVLLTCSNGVYIAHMKDKGLDPNYVATVVSVHSLTLALFKFLSGVIYDKFGLRVSISVCCITSVIGSLLLACVTDSPAGMVIAMCQGIVGSIAQPLETVMIPLITSGLFGEKDYVKIMGIFVAITAAGCAIGSPISNWFYDAQGTYVYCLLLVSAIMLVTYIVFMFTQSAANKCRDRMLTESEQ